MIFFLKLQPLLTCLIFSYHVCFCYTLMDAHVRKSFLWRRMIMKKCPQCGQMQDDAVKFCVNCGYKFEENIAASAPAPNATVEPTPRRRRNQVLGRKLTPSLRRLVPSRRLQHRRQVPRRHRLYQTKPSKRPSMPAATTGAGWFGRWRIQAMTRSVAISSLVWHRWS